MRCDLQLPISLELGETCYRGITFNISLGGVALLLDKSVKPVKDKNDYCGLWLPLTNENILIKCQTAHIAENRAGLKFISITDEQKQQLRYFLISHL